MAQTAQPGQTNGFDPNILQGYIDRVENVQNDIASETGSFMKSIQGMKTDIKDILAEAKDQGIPMKALKAELKLRKLDRDKVKIVAGLEEEDAQSLEAIQAALGDFASSPLGDAAVKAVKAASPN